MKHWQAVSIPLLSFFLLLLSSMPQCQGQDPQYQPSKELQQILAQFEQGLTAAQSAKNPVEAHKQAMASHARKLQSHLQSGIQGEQLAHTRILLVQTTLHQGKREAAQKILTALAPSDTNALWLLRSAVLAEQMQLPAQRKQWVEAALRKKTGLSQRMQLAQMLMTELVEVEKGEAIFQQALKQAKDGGQRAEILWHRCTAIREREDLHETAYEESLNELAKQYPDTLYGGIAGDRYQALHFKVGSPAIDVALEFLDGKKQKLKDFSGQVLLLHFWSADRDSKEQLKELQALYAKHQERGLQILSVSLDDKRETLAMLLQDKPLPWPQAFGGAGWDSHLALRYKVEHTPYLLLLGRDFKVAALRLSIRDEHSRKELMGAIEEALANR